MSRYIWGAMRLRPWVLTLAGLSFSLTGAAQPPLDLVDPWKREPITPKRLDKRDPWVDTNRKNLDNRDPWDETLKVLPEIRDAWRDRSAEVGATADPGDPWDRNVPTAVFPPVGGGEVVRLTPRYVPKAPRAPVPTATFPLL